MFSTQPIANSAALLVTVASGLNLGLIRTFRFLLPPLCEQRAIAAVLDSIDEAIERTEAVIAATKRLRDALLHELLTRGLPGRHTEFKQKSSASESIPARTGKLCGWGMWLDVNLQQCGTQRIVHQSCTWI